MADDAKRMRAALGLARFGFGARPGDLEQGDPKARLLAEIDPAAALIVDSGLPGSAENLQRVAEFRQERREQRAEAMPDMAPPAMTDAPERGRQRRSDDPAPQQVIFLAEAEARFSRINADQAGYAERMVWFWSNHFCVSARKGPRGRATAGAYEREAIRPHVFGRFSDMLLAVAQHPAMLHYLDNAGSIGPNSIAGKRRSKGLNENYARETLELHSLGADGGYSQEDVTNLAKILTGWTIAGPRAENGEAGMFVFNRRQHEPGPIELLGKSYADRGIRQGEAALADLVRHPSTARHMARKLARHFVSDDPPSVLVAKLEDAFARSDGDLAVVSGALIDAPEAWELRRTSLRKPMEFFAAATVALGLEPELRPSLRALEALGQPLWQPPGPNGFPDEAAPWATPEGVKSRLDLASELARRATTSLTPSECLLAVCGPALSAETRQAVSRAESRDQGFTILLMAPEFMRR
jgi:uncharacterized protein (DUF1800 family)